MCIHTSRRHYLVLGLLLKCGEKRCSLNMLEARRIMGLNRKKGTHPNTLEPRVVTFIYTCETAQLQGNVVRLGRFRVRVCRMYECEDGRRWEKGGVLSKTVSWTNEVYTVLKKMIEMNLHSISLQRAWMTNQHVSELSIIFSYLSVPGLAACPDSCLCPALAPTCS